MSNQDHPDRRVQRTRRNLRAALLALIEEQGYESITVQQVAARADVGRATFYLHYADKEQLLLDCIQEALRMLSAELEEPSIADLPQAAHALSLRAFTYIGTTQGVYRALLSEHGAAPIVSKLRDMIAAQIARQMHNAFSQHALGATLLTAVAQHTAGALLALITWWLHNQSELTPADMANLHQQLVAPGIKQLLEATSHRSAPT